jgi:sulfatase family protein
VRNIRQYRVKALPNGTHEEQPLTQHDKVLATKAQSYYQFVNLYLNAK